jgi:hypothetical protein
MRTACVASKKKKILIVELKKEKKKYLELIKQIKAHHEQIRAHKKAINLINQKAKPSKQILKKLISKHYKLESEVVIEDSTRFCWGLGDEEITELAQLLAKV